MIIQKLTNSTVSYENYLMKIISPTLRLSDFGALLDDLGIQLLAAAGAVDVETALGLLTEASLVTEPVGKFIRSHHGFRLESHVALHFTSIPEQIKSDKIDLIRSIVFEFHFPFRSKNLKFQ